MDSTAGYESLRNTSLLQRSDLFTPNDLSMNKSLARSNTVITHEDRVSGTTTEDVLRRLVSVCLLVTLVAKKINAGEELAKR